MRFLVEETSLFHPKTCFPLIPKSSEFCKNIFLNLKGLSLIKHIKHKYSEKEVTVWNKFWQIALSLPTIMVLHINSIYVLYAYIYVCILIIEKILNCLYIFLNVNSYKELKSHSSRGRNYFKTVFLICGKNESYKRVHLCYYYVDFL